MNEHERALAIDVPYTSLQPATLRALVEEFVTRDTTDYGERERTLEEKVADIMRQLRRGDRHSGSYCAVTSIVSGDPIVCSTTPRSPRNRLGLRLAHARFRSLTA